MKVVTAVDNPYHIPVLLHDCIKGLSIKPDGIYLDATFGGGGHALAILEKLGADGKLFAFDRDSDAQQNIPTDDRFELIEGNFEFIKNFVRERGINKVDGILADLGISSHQIDVPERGFSIRFDAPLDMRMDRKEQITAAQIANSYSEDELKRIFRKYAELRNAAAISRKIAQARAEYPIETVNDLKKSLAGIAPRGKENQFYAKVFQAFRIEVNRELEVLEKFLERSADLLKPGGRLVVMSYHSLEDRLVKNYMRAGNTSGIPEKDFYGHIIRPFKPLKSKPVKPAEDEIKINNRARSARLRVAERI